MVVPGLISLKIHIKNIHGLTFNRGGGNRGFQCGEVNCNNHFVEFSGLVRHVRAHHVMPNENDLDRMDDDGGVEDMDHDDIDDRDAARVDAVGQQYEDHVPHQIPNQNEERDIHEDGTDDDDEQNDNDDFFMDNYDINNFDLRSHIVRMIGKFHCLGSITDTLLNKFVEESEKLLIYTTRFLRSKVQTFINNQGLLQDAEAQAVLESFNWNNPFNGLKTLSGRIKALKEYWKYVKSNKIPLGYRTDNVLDKLSGTHRPKMVMETFQYVPVIETLELVLSNPRVRQAILNEQKSTDEDLLCSYLDGDHVKVHPYI